MTYKLRYLTLAFCLMAGMFQAFASQYPKRALRGVWIATVTNIDWPSKPGLPDEEQKRELVALFDEVVSHNMNTVILQVRPTADAFYYSRLEPSSHWLTGKQGAALNYDPLQFAIDECRKRGLNIHVWLNPYRINADTAQMAEYAPMHVCYQHPEWFVTYGKAAYFNPALDEVRSFINKVVADIVKNYDIDAIHMDDYFYPYKVKGAEFPDEEAWKKYPRGFTNKEDWRRNNVNLIIRELNTTIKQIKPWVEFGISPFAIWRNKAEDPRGSDTKAMTNYDGLYADILTWQEKGWIDYVVPQLYFHIGYPIADYAVLADWWAKYNYGTNVYAGLAPYRVGKKAKQKEWRSPKQLVKQINRNRRDPNLKGEVYFSAKSMFSPAVDLKKRLIAHEYKYKAIVPENNRITRIEAQQPLEAGIAFVADKVRFSWKRGTNAKRFVIYKLKKGKPVDLNDPETIVGVTGETSFELSRKEYNPSYRYGVTSLSPSHSESNLVWF